jgi:plasmid stabilization system protein ParE
MDGQLGDRKRNESARMPQIIFTRRAQIDLERLKSFLATESPRAAKNAVNALKTAFLLIHKHPRIGKMQADANQHDLIVPFGASGYIIRYELREEIILILAIRHQKEVGF